MEQIIILFSSKFYVLIKTLQYSTVDIERSIKLAVVYCFYSFYYALLERKKNIHFNNEIFLIKFGAALNDI